MQIAIFHNSNEIRKIIVDHESSLKSISQCILELLWQLFLYSFLGCHQIKNIIWGVEVYVFDSGPKLDKIIGNLRFLRFDRIVRKVSFLKDSV